MNQLEKRNAARIGRYLNAIRNCIDPVVMDLMLVARPADPTPLDWEVLWRELTNMKERLAWCVEICEQVQAEIGLNANPESPGDGPA